MEVINNKLNFLQQKLDAGDTVKVMIVGLGSVGGYLLDYLVGCQDAKMEIIVVGRNRDKLEQDVNIVRTAATIRGVMRSKITIDGRCDLDNINSITETFSRHQPDFIVNSSRMYAGLKYGSISWNALRAYGIWTPLSIRYVRNIMTGYRVAGCHAIVINTSYSDAVIPWLKSAGELFPDFGSGNLNHLIPRIKFYIAEQYRVDNLNDIDVTLATSHFHDVVISKEGHTEGQEILLDIRYQGKRLDVEQSEIFRHCAIAMPVDQKRNMMNASSNFNIMHAILEATRLRKKMKIHSPGVLGEIGGYPYIIDGEKACSYFDESIFSMFQMRDANRKSIALDGIEDVIDGKLIYTDVLVEKVRNTFCVDLPKIVHFTEIDEVGNFIVEQIIERNK